MNISLKLFLAFLKIGLLSIGGGYAVIPLIQEQVVERAGWISQKVFTDIITISQMTPGPLAVNTSTFVGLRISGIAGAVAATVGCVLCGIVISLLLYRFFQKHSRSTYALAVQDGLRSASLGLIISAAATILLLALFGTDTVRLTDAFSQMNWTALFIFAGMLFVLRRWKLNPVLAMVMSGVIGFVFYS